jgi:hypothetical protein
MVDGMASTIQKDMKFRAAADDALKGVKHGKVKRFVCPLCGAMSLAKHEPNGRLKAYCQGCGISCLG